MLAATGSLVRLPINAVTSRKTARNQAVTPSYRSTGRDASFDAHGIGPAKAERYGEGFLGVIRETLAG